MKPMLRWYQLCWPRTVDADRLNDLTRLLGASTVSPLVLQAVGQYGHVRHQVGVPESAAGGLRRQLQAALPGLVLERLDERPQVAFHRATAIALSTARRP